MFIKFRSIGICKDTPPSPFPHQHKHITHVNCSKSRTIKTPEALKVRTFILLMKICHLNFREKPWPLCPPTPLCPPFDCAYLNRQPCNSGCIKNDAANHSATHVVCNFGALTCLREAQNCAMVRQTWSRGYFKLKIFITLH